MNPDDILTVTEVAELLRRSTRWVRDNIRSGEIPSVKIGGSVFIPRSELADRLTSGQGR